MKQKYVNLCSPIKIRNTLFRNRLMAGPGGPSFSQSAEPYPADEFVATFAQRARSGASAVVCLGMDFEVHKSDDPIQGHMIRIMPADPLVHHRYAEIAEIIKAEGSVPCIQCMPSRELVEGYDVSEGVLSEYVEGDGSVPVTGKEAPAELLYQVAQEYGRSAALAKELGYKMVQLHMAYRNMLPGRFLSKYTNKRTDEFGGSLENRARFPLMICEEIKKAAGTDMITSVAITAEEPYRDGLSIEETLEFVKLAEGKIDVLSIREHQIDYAQGPYFTGVSLPNRPAYHRIATYIRENGINMKLAYVCGGHDLDECEDLIASGDADFILTTRGFIANPDMAEKMREGRGDDIVPCLRCNKCHQAKPMHWSSVCSVNPSFALEYRLEHMTTPPKSRRKVAVVGGGCAGMKAAIDLYDRGHSVTIFEKEEKLGGQLNLAAVPDFKWTLARFRNYLIHQVEKRDITVCLNREIGPGELDQEFDMIFVALGAEPAIPQIPGANGLMTYKDAFERPGEVKGRVTIIGGGEIGLELGIFLVKQGHEVCVLEMKDILAAEMAPIHFRRPYREMWESLEGFSWKCGACVTGIDGGNVIFEQNGSAGCIQADTVILAVGSKANDAEAMAFGGDDRHRIIGDCFEVGNISSAMRQAYFAANNV